MSKLNNEALIDRLQEESKPGVGTHATGRYSGFPPVDASARFEGGVLGSVAPTQSAAMTELIRRGVSALPALLDHLSDARATKLTVGGEFFSAAWFSDEYDSRFDDEARSAKGVNSIDSHSRPFSTYTLKVADFCYVAIGQIVHRRLLAVRYQPSGNLVVNSPIECPGLAAAARAEWRGLKPAELERSLLGDFEKDFIRQDGALPRLLFYFPETGRKAVQPLLEVSLCDMNAGGQFAFGDLAKAPPESHAAMLARFRSEHQEKDYEYLWTMLVKTAAEPITHEPIHDGERQESIGLLARLFPRELPGSISEKHFADYESQQRLLVELAPFNWEGLDAAILALYRQAVDDKPATVGARIGRDDLALECARRLVRHDSAGGDFAGFFSAQVIQMQRDDEAAQSNDPVLRQEMGAFHVALSQRIEIYGNFVRELGGAAPEKSAR